ncbi:hypothetical protein D3C71_2195760 [compost metagenome]
MHGAFLACYVGDEGDDAGSGQCFDIGAASNGDHVCPLGMQEFRRGQADAAGRAGNDGDLACEGAGFRMA